MVFCLTVSALLAYPFNLSGVPAYKNNPDSLSTAFNNRGVDYAIAGDYEKAGELFLKALRILQQSGSSDRSSLGRGFFNLANLKMLLGYSDSAVVYYQLATNYYRNSLANKKDLAAVYVEMGSCYYYRNEYHEASSFIQQGIALLQESSPVDNHRLVLANYKLCNVLTKMGQYEEALKISLTNLDLARKYSPLLCSTISNGIGVTYSHLNNYDRTLYYYKQAEHYSKENGSVNKDELASIYNNIGVFYKEYSKWVDAEQYLRKALACYQARGNNPVQTAQVLVNLGGVKLAQRRAQEALQLFVCAEKYNNKPLVNGTRKSGVVSRYLSPGLAASIFEGKGDAYVELNRLHASIDNGMLAMASYQHSIGIVEEIRIGIFGEEDKLSVSSEYNEVFNKAVAAAYQMGNSRGNLELGFRLASKGKAAILSESLNRLNSLSVSGVPVKVQAEERRLRQRIGLLTEIVYEEEKKSNPSAQYLRTVENSLFETQQAYRSQLQSIKVNYPNYFSLKFDTSAVSISQVQKKLRYNQVYIEYVIQDSSLYIFALTKERSAWNYQKLDRTFFASLKEFQRQLVPSDFGKLTKQDLDLLSTSGYHLYQKLLEPFAAMFIGKELIIVPHNELTSIPFNALITKKVGHVGGYYDLPYLITQNSVLYALSSKVFVGGGNSVASIFPSALSVAPTYKGTTSPSLSSREAYRDNLAELYGAEDEVKWVSQIFHGDVLAGKDATEHRFKEVSSRYDILHLAMHTYTDSVNPMFSKLIFYNSTDTTEDGYLNAYEVYNMRIKARLAILSACRSGDGNLVKGEGLMSIARGFRFAGCPSLVVTQWRVDDYSGGEVIKNFAKNLKRGYAKSDAMRIAQLSFLATADPLRSHPYFWAGYQVVGEDTPLFIPVSMLCIPIIILLIALAQLFLSTRLFRRFYSLR